ncbi:MAG: hypothetical protein M3548_01850 [Actinomycetota bacterium]|nr:hypothetical protein [Actinomycetota bacterium]
MRGSRESSKYESERTIYLSDELIAILSEHVRQHTPEGEPSRWLFDEGGKPWHDNLVDYRWRSTRTDAGVTSKLHELQWHCANSLCTPKPSAGPPKPRLRQLRCACATSRRMCSPTRRFAACSP